jgi:Prokaryotic E2 family E
MSLEEVQADASELEALTGVKVEVRSAGLQVFLVLRQVTLPATAYQVDVTDVLFITDQQYRMSALDMFWTDLGVLRPDGTVPQNADLIETYLERQWRRFSWHRNGRWEPNRNGLVDHYEFMVARFAIDASAVAT